MSSPHLACLKGCARVLTRISRGHGLLLALAYAGLIFWLSSHRVHIPLLAFGWRSLGHDFAHALAFGLLALLAVLVLPRRDLLVSPAGGCLLRAPALTGRRALFLWLVVLLYGVSDELHQAFVPGRVASVFDVLTDGAGAAATIWIIAYVLSRDASGRGLTLRFLAGLLACVFCAALSSWFPGGGWSGSA